MIYRANQIGLERANTRAQYVNPAGQRVRVTIEMDRDYDDTDPMLSLIHI